MSEKTCNLAALPTVCDPASRLPPPSAAMDDLLRTALLAADAAAHVQRRWAGRIRVEDARDKGVSDFVTRTDVEAQEAVLRVIRGRHPRHAILAEEAEEGEALPSSAPTTQGDGGGAGERGGDPGATPPAGEEEEGPSRASERGSEPEGAVASGSGPEETPGSDVRAASPEEARDGPSSGAWPEGPLWVVDPLDGTTNFIHRHPMYTVSVGLVLEGRPAVGAVVCPATGERWWAARGRGAWKGGRRIEVSGQTEIRGALVGTGFPFKALDLLDAYQAQFARVLRSTAGIRRGGSAALDLCYLAQGSLDAFWELVLSPWDVAAGLAILSEAGGTSSRLEGGEIGPERGTVLAANSTGLQDALGALVRGEGVGGHGTSKG